MPLHRGEHHRPGGRPAPGRDRRPPGARRRRPRSGPDGAGTGRARRSAAARRGAGQPPGGGPDPRRIRLTALMGIVACAVVLPFAVASAGPVSEIRPQVRESSAPSGGGADGKAPGTGPSGTPRLGLGAATAVRCGPELTSPGGIEAQTCLLVQPERTWARTSYRNATGGPLHLALSLTGPGGRTVQVHCAVGRGDEPGTCETPREHLRGEPAAYSAVAEFAASDEGAATGPLLLRAGSNSPARAGS